MKLLILGIPVLFCNLFCDQNNFGSLAKLILWSKQLLIKSVILICSSQGFRVSVTAIAATSAAFVLSAILRIKRNWLQSQFKILIKSFLEAEEEKRKQLSPPPKKKLHHTISFWLTCRLLILHVLFIVYLPLSCFSV